MLVKTLQKQFESIYQIPLSLSIEDFLIDQETLNYIKRKHCRLLSKCSNKGLMLLSIEKDELCVGIYLHEQVIKTLHRYNPLLGLHEKNIYDFCIMVEEVSHFLYTTWKAQLDRQITELEIELQAEIDKFIFCTLYFLNQRNYHTVLDLKKLLFDAFHFDNNISEESKDRYLTASTFARHYCHFLERHYITGNHFPQLLEEIRRFYRLSQTEKISHINRYH